MFGCLRAIALPVGLDDVDAESKPFEPRAGESFVAQDLGSVLEVQVRRDDEALAFVGAASDFAEQLGDQGGDGEEAYLLALHARGMIEGGGDVGFAGTGIAEERDVLMARAASVALTGATGSNTLA